MFILQFLKMLSEYVPCPLHVPCCTAKSFATARLLSTLENTRHMWWDIPESPTWSSSWGSYLQGIIDNACRSTTCLVRWRLCPPWANGGVEEGEDTWRTEMTVFTQASGHQPSWGTAWHNPTSLAALLPNVMVSTVWRRRASGYPQRGGPWEGFLEGVGEHWDSEGGPGFLSAVLAKLRGASQLCEEVRGSCWSEMLCVAWRWHVMRKRMSREARTLG